MLRAMLFVALAIAACHKDSDPPPMHPKEGDLPPLPPSSGTPIGYLVDNAAQLKLNDDQLRQLRDIDNSLSARDSEIDTQLRIIEKPEQDPAAGQDGTPVRHNNAPGAQQVHTTPDTAKLHAARKENDFEALQKAFVLLTPEQQATARRLLEERGVNAPGSQPKPQQRGSDDGIPMEP